MCACIYHLYIIITLVYKKKEIEDSINESSNCTFQIEYNVPFCVTGSSVSNICSGVQEWKKEGYIMSPNYPTFYPTNQDCLCKLQAEWGSKIDLIFYDLLLETREGRCRADWLMLRQKTQKQRHCGAIMTGSKSITSTKNTMTLQFHSDKHDNRTQKFQYFTRQLKGFWVYFKGIFVLLSTILLSVYPYIHIFYKDIIFNTLHSF